MGDVLPWLLDQDPALRWRVERDLVGAPTPVWQATRARVATEGLGARLLALQDADGQWAGGAFFPRGFEGDDDGQPWTATTWSLNALRDGGLDAAALGDTAERLAANSRWEYDDLPYWGGEVDVCINAWTLQNGIWLGVDMAPLAQWFVDHQAAEGGWNCEWVEGSTRASFHSTLNAVRAILDCERAGHGTPALRAARRAGEEYLLSRRLRYRATTGERVAPWVDAFVYPSRAYYNVLNAVSHFVGAARFDGTSPDPRLEEAIALIRGARTPEGTWTQDRRHPGEVWFELDVPVGAPSPWLTYYALRALRWWDHDES